MDEQILANRIFLTFAWVLALLWTLRALYRDAGKKMPQGLVDAILVAGLGTFLTGLWWIWV